MPEEIIVEVLREVQGIPVEALVTDTARKCVFYKTLMPVLTHLPDGTHEVCATGFDFCMN
jgi:hypothetical protein